MADHVAILRKSKIKQGDNLLEQILSGTKTIESRWYVNKIAPWGKIKTGDTVYFKNSGEPVVAKAKVKKVLQFELNTLEIARDIIRNYGKQISPKISEKEFLKWYKEQPKKKYCILIFLEKSLRIPSFSITKKGFGSACAWLTVKDIHLLKFS